MNKVEEIVARQLDAVANFREIEKTARRKSIWPYQDKFASEEYLELSKDAREKLDAALEDYYRHNLSMRGPQHFSRENVFVWGGPTPSWGGSMAADASLRAKDFFGFDNVMYVYGPLNRDTMELHRGCKKLICHLGTNCRTAGAAMASDVEEAELLSRLSLEFTNVKGAVLDDMICNCGTNYSRKQYLAIKDALKKHNPELELYGVVYTHELDSPIANMLRDCMDRIILWTWSCADLPDLDLNLEKCIHAFPGKPIMMGVFMFDYGLTALPNSVPSMVFQLTKARKYLSEGKIQDIIILGDREIEKCPQVAAFIRDFFQKEFQTDI